MRGRRCRRRPSPSFAGRRHVKEIYDTCSSSRAGYPPSPSSCPRFRLRLSICVLLPCRWSLTPMFFFLPHLGFLLEPSGPLIGAMKVTFRLPVGIRRTTFFLFRFRASVLLMCALTSWINLSNLVHEAPFSHPSSPPPPHAR